MEEKKLVYCFLTYDNLVRTDIWEKYFQYENKYKVFIHSKEEIYPYNYTFPVNILQNRIHTKSKSDISIVTATLHLLREAYDKTPEGSHFIFLTQSCIPLYNFGKHYKLITKMDKSCVSIKLHNKTERYFSLSLFLKMNIKNHQFVKQQPNMILTREDVKWFLDNMYIEDFRNMECPDEHYFVNLFLHVYKKDFMKQQINYCNIHVERTQAETFYNIDKHCIIRARIIGSLFMRKASRFSKIDEKFILE